MLDSSPYRLPLILLSVSIVLKMSITYAICPYIVNNVVDVDANECFKVPEALWMNTYAQMYTRAGPYFLGMIAAYWHLNPETRPVLNPICQTILEYFCVYILILNKFQERLTDFVSFPVNYRCLVLMHGSGYYVFGILCASASRYCRILPLSAAVKIRLFPVINSCQIF